VAKKRECPDTGLKLQRAFFVFILTDQVQGIKLSKKNSRAIAKSK
jgi:hypothetical protein